MEELANEAMKHWMEGKMAHEERYDSVAQRYAKDSKSYIDAFLNEQDEIKLWLDKCSVKEGEGLINRIDLLIRTMRLPNTIPRVSRSYYDSDSKILIHDHQFPDLSSLEWFKTVRLKSGLTTKSANQKEKKEISNKFWPALSLRLICQILLVDHDDLIDAIVINGWANYVDKATGQDKRAYCVSLFATKDQIKEINLSSVDPLIAFNRLKGITAQSLEVTPICPIMSFDKNDSRFVDAREVLSQMTTGENLASMDWEDFEHLCRELFEQVFANSGAEVKVTQASRDQGVDAIIFDPDPVRGGKLVIQAKRYTNIVDVSAVRDLYGAVINEGAMKGILVTTSYFGPEAYAFVKDKPLTLLNGQELLGLLEAHGYKFKIDLIEAKKLASSYTGKGLYGYA